MQKRMFEKLKIQTMTLELNINKDCILWSLKTKEQGMSDCEPDTIKLQKLKVYITCNKYQDRKDFV